MKKWTMILSFAVAILAACGNDDDSIVETPNSTAVANDNGTNEANTSNEKVDEELAPESTSNYAPKDELEAEFFDYIAQMNRWDSYSSNFMYYDYYLDEDQITTEINNEIQYVVSPAQVYRNLHTINFSNSHIEQYVNETDGGYQNDNMNGWYAMESTDHTLKNPLPATAELMQALVANSDESTINDETDEYAHSAVFSIYSDESVKQDMYKKINTALFKVLTDDEVTQDDLDMEELENIKGIYTTIYLNDNYEFVAYSITIHHNFESDEHGDSISIFESFENINGISEIIIPDEVTTSIL